ncbi:hypothetical protein QJQ45_018101, partial [Haematococcus lacustris]
MERNRQRKRNRNASGIEVDRELGAEPEPSQAQKNKKASGEARRDRHDNNTWHAKKAKLHTVMRGVCAAGLEAGAVVASEVVEARVVTQLEAWVEACSMRALLGSLLLGLAPSEAVEDVLAFYPGLHARLNAVPRYEHDFNTVDDVGTKLETNFANSLTELFPRRVEQAVAVAGARVIAGSHEHQRRLWLPADGSPAWTERQRSWVARSVQGKVVTWLEGQGGVVPTAAMRDEVARQRRLLVLGQGVVVNDAWLERGCNRGNLLCHAVDITRQLEAANVSWQLDWAVWQAAGGQRNTRPYRPPSPFALTPSCSCKAHHIKLDTQALFGLMRTAGMLPADITSLPKFRSGVAGPRDSEVAGGRLFEADCLSLGDLWMTSSVLWFGGGISGIQQHHHSGEFQWKPDHAARYVGALIALEEEVMAVKQAVEQGTHPDSINRFVHDIISRAAGSAGMLRPRLCPLARVDKHTTVKPAWFDRSCKEAKAALWQALRSGEALHLYRARKQAYRRLVARAKSAWSKHRAAKLLDMLKHNPGDALKMLRVKHARQQSMVPIDKWHQHLQAYFTTTTTTHEAPDVIPEPARTRQAVPAHLQAVPLGRGRLHSVPTESTHPPAYELPHLDNITSIVQAQLRELNNDTAPGLDGLPAPFIKHARTVEEGVTTYLLLPLLATWIHSMMRTGIIPAAWKVARISPLFKDTDPTDPSKYRMLAVSSVLYRLYANVLRHVLTAWCMTHKVLPAEQFGFIPGRSTMQPMFILRHLVHAQKASADAKHRKLFTAFIDFKQAYDHIPRQQLWEHLRVGVKLPQPLLACLEGLYRDDSYVLIDGPHRTPPVTPDQGVKQGCPISPLLFALYVHDISKEFLGPVDAVRVQGTPVTHFMYADDLTLVSTSSHGLQRLVCQLQGFADRKHLTVNVGKSKVMVFNGNSQTAAPSIGYKHEILPVVREFKYLGMHFNPSATPAFAATHMRAGMFLAMRQACKRAREYGVLHDPYALCHLIRAFVLPLGLYGSQVWGTAFLGHGVQLSSPVQTRMLSFL